MFNFTGFEVTKTLLGISLNFQRVLSKEGTFTLFVTHVLAWYGVLSRQEKKKNKDK